MALVNGDGWIGALPLGGDRPRPADLAALIVRPAWMADALCRERPDLTWFPELGEHTDEAKRVCAACLVKAECRDYAIDNGETTGIWGAA